MTIDGTERIQRRCPSRVVARCEPGSLCKDDAKAPKPVRPPESGSTGTVCACAQAISALK